jgi:DNA-binding CsgD family transcriptional regulator
LELDTLTERETEILAELAKGGRIPSIASELFISPHTVRNHLRSIFSKLGVHSQAELIAYVKANPGLLGEDSGVDDERAEIDRWSQASAVGDLRVAAQIADILDNDWNAEGLRQVLRLVLPLDAQSEAEWQARISLWGREVTDAELLAPHIERLNTRRVQVRQRVEQAQQQGWVRSDVEAEVLAKGLYSMILGAALQILRDQSDAARTQQLFVLDAYIDSITTSG